MNSWGSAAAQQSLAREQQLAKEAASKEDCEAAMKEIEGAGGEMWYEARHIGAGGARSLIVLRLDRWVPATSGMIRSALFCAALALASRSRLSR